jgi:hypothetical protein
MNKYILVDIVTEKLAADLGMTAKPLPKEIKVMKTVLPSGKVRFESTLYQTKKLKRVTISKRNLGGNIAGTVLMMVSASEYDIPFTLVDIAFDSAEKRISAAFQIRLLLNDTKSTTEYVKPFASWLEKLLQLPSKPMSPFGEPGEFIKANPPELKYQRTLSDNYTDEVLKLTRQFFDIYRQVYKNAEPVTDAKRRSEMNAFRSAYNEHILGDDPSGKMLIKTFGQRTAALFYDYLVYL